MKRNLLIISFLIGMALSGFTQNPKLGSRIEALKVAYITKKLDLSTEEAQRFWPVYNQYSSEIRDIRVEQRQKGASELDTEEKILKVRKKYNNEFTKALNADKTNKFFQAEKDFGNVVQKELSERREARQNRNRE